MFKLEARHVHADSAQTKLLADTISELLVSACTYFKLLCLSMCIKVPSLHTKTGSCPIGQWCPEENANIWSRYFFTYVDSILGMGFRKPLHQEDLWDLAPRDLAPQVSTAFQDSLDSDPHKGSVVRAMWQCYGGPFVRAGLIKFVHDIIMFTGNFLDPGDLKHSCFTTGHQPW